ncbi:hypothetical protein HMI55_002799 [Coelomomyces lativittatus]|nr:hypothetical protein HMI55_002799 [Coelomomyces lativittatus]
MESVLVPPLNFAMVCSGVYRSGYPNRKNFTFLKTLQLKTLIYVCPESYAEENQRFAEENQIQVFHYQIKSNKVLDHEREGVLLIFMFSFQK